MSTRAGFRTCYAIKIPKLYDVKVFTAVRIMDSGFLGYDVAVVSTVPKRMTW
jgi:hypothetical protein